MRVSFSSFFRSFFLVFCKYLPLFLVDSFCYLFISLCVCVFFLILSFSLIPCDGVQEENGCCSCTSTTLNHLNRFVFFFFLLLLFSVLSCDVVVRVLSSTVPMPIQRHIHNLMNKSSRLREWSWLGQTSRRYMFITRQIRHLHKAHGIAGSCGQSH